MRISDWSSDVCSSDLERAVVEAQAETAAAEVRRQNAEKDLASTTAGPAHANERIADLEQRLAEAPERPAALRAEAVAECHERSEGRRVRDVCMSQCRYCCSPYLLKTHY